MGYSVSACAYIGVRIVATDEQMEQIDAFCKAHHGIQHDILGFDQEEDLTPCCIYVHRLELEQWGHSAYVNDHSELELNITDEHKRCVAELLSLINEKHQDLKLILSLCGS